MKILKQQHAEFLAKVKASGAKTAFYKAPCCGAAVEDRLAGAGEMWDTWSTCPHCEALYWKVTTDSAITATLPQR